MATETLPAPLVPPEVDLGGYEWMPLLGDKMLNSETWILASAEAKVAALTLWWQSYAHQCPAGSLPNNDRLLADAAGYGVAVTAWKAVKEEAMRGWVLCSDGRLYHPVVAKLALQAWETRLADIAKKEADRMRKKKPKSSDGQPPEGSPNEMVLPPENGDASNGKRGDVRRTGTEIPTEPTTLSNGPSAGNPPENALKGQERTGKEKSTGVVKSSAGGPRAPARDDARPPPDDPGDGISAVRRGVTAAFERWFDMPDRPFGPADEEHFAAWLEAGAQRGLSPADTAAAIVGEVDRQFRKLADGGKGHPRSLRAVLDADVRNALAAAKPTKASKPLAAVPEPFAGHFEPVEYERWIAPCRFDVIDGVGCFVAPSRMHRDWLNQQLAERLKAALGVSEIEATVATSTGRNAA